MLIWTLFILVSSKISTHYFNSANFFQSPIFSSRKVVQIALFKGRVFEKRKPSPRFRKALDLHFPVFKWTDLHFNIYLNVSDLNLLDLLSWEPQVDETISFPYWNVQYINWLFSNRSVWLATSFHHGIIK